MGTEYYIVNHKTKTLFDLGKSFWNFTNDNSVFLDRAYLLEAICKVYAYNDNFTAGYCLWLRDCILEFVEGANLDSDIKIISEHDILFEDFIDKKRDRYPITMDRHINGKELEDYLFKKY